VKIALATVSIVTLVFATVTGAQSRCTVSMPVVDFGDVLPGASGDIVVNGDFQVTCISALPGSQLRLRVPNTAVGYGTQGNRLLTSPGSRGGGIPYRLEIPSMVSVPRGAFASVLGASSLKSAIRDGATDSRVPFRATVQASAFLDVAPGRYTDRVQVVAE